MSDISSSNFDSTMYSSLDDFLSTLPPITSNPSDEKATFLAQFERDIGNVSSDVLMDVADCVMEFGIPPEGVHNLMDIILTQKSPAKKRTSTDDFTEGSAGDTDLPTTPTPKPRLPMQLAHSDQISDDAIKKILLTTGPEPIPNIDQFDWDFEWDFSLCGPLDTVVDAPQVEDIATATRPETPGPTDDDASTPKAAPITLTEDLAGPVFIPATPPVLELAPNSAPSPPSASQFNFKLPQANIMRGITRSDSEMSDTFTAFHGGITRSNSEMSDAYGPTNDDVSTPRAAPVTLAEDLAGPVFIPATPPVLELAPNPALSPPSASQFNFKLPQANIIRGITRSDSELSDIYTASNGGITRSNSELSDIYTASNGGITRSNSLLSDTYTASERELSCTPVPTPPPQAAANGETSSHTGRSRKRKTTDGVQAGATKKQKKNVFCPYCKKYFEKDLRKHIADNAKCDNSDKLAIYSGEGSLAPHASPNLHIKRARRTSNSVLKPHQSQECVILIPATAASGGGELQENQSSYIHIQYGSNSE